MVFLCLRNEVNQLSPSRGCSRVWWASRASRLRSHWFRFCVLFGEVTTLELVRPLGTTSTVQLLISYKETV